MKLRALAEEAYPELASALGALPDVSVRGVECDSRKVKEGFIFVAVRGVKQDGAGFAAEAVKNASAARTARQAVRSGRGERLNRSGT